jgi:bifunctional UDP-N-acetylglucosamine pyrophosphorylase / glucosamine-1-phosphate N-acetyltransferase
MHSNLPKVLHPIAGKALVSHVIDTARSLSPANCAWSTATAATRARRRWMRLISRGRRRSRNWAPATPWQQALPHLKDEGTTLVLYGDVPLIQAESTLKR